MLSVLAHFAPRMQTRSQKSSGMLGSALQTANGSVSGRMALGARAVVSWRALVAAAVAVLVAVLTMAMAAPALAVPNDVMGWGGGSPVAGVLGELRGVTALAQGQAYGLALMSDGTVLSWGANEYGERGDGTYEGPGEPPTTVSGLSGVTAISAAGHDSLALLSNGTVMAWGKGEQGQLGDGSFESSDVPVPVSGLSGVTAISAGWGESLALLSNGMVMEWGEPSDLPVAVSGLSGVTAISESNEGEKVAALKNGTVVEWVPGGEPVTVSGLSGVIAVSAGWGRSISHNLALLSNGTVMAWGYNWHGDLGDGSYEPTQVPVAVSGLTEVTAIGAGYNNSVALLSNGTVMAWGGNEDGALGNGTTSGSSDIPVVVGGLGAIEGISTTGGGSGGLAYGPPLPGVTALGPNSGEMVGFTPVIIEGFNLTGATAVDFGSTPAISFEVTSSNYIHAVAPAGMGTVAVTVTTPEGISSLTPADNYTYGAGPPPRPVVKKVSPTGGVAAGEAPVTITGTNLAGASAVDFGSTSAKSFTVNSATTITAVSPAGTGTVNITVTTPGGTSAVVAKDQFKYGVPTVTAVSPNSGPLTGGTSVTVTGSGFALGETATTFKVGKALATAVRLQLHHDMRGRHTGC